MGMWTRIIGVDDATRLQLVERKKRRAGEGSLGMIVAGGYHVLGTSHLYLRGEFLGFVD
jgi:hypothetical protein